MPGEKSRFSIPKPNTCGEFVGLDTAGPQAEKKGIKHEFKLRAVLVSYQFLSITFKWNDIHYFVKKIIPLRTSQRNSISQFHNPAQYWKWNGRSKCFQKILKIFSFFYSHNCTLINGVVFYSICTVWLSSVAPECFIFGYCAWLWNSLICFHFLTLNDVTHYSRWRRSGVEIFSVFYLQISRMKQEWHYRTFVNAMNVSGLPSENNMGIALSSP